MQAVFIQEGDSIDYTPVSAVAVGQVVVIGDDVFVAKMAIAAGALGSVCGEGVFDMVKITGALTAGDKVYWNPTGNPVGGVAGTGAIQATASGSSFAGVVVESALSADETVKVKLQSSNINSETVAGSMTADDITGSDASLGISGKAGTAGGAGGIVAVVGGAGDTNGAGGAVTRVGGAGAGSGAGGAASMAGGVGGATGAGGAASVAGGAGGASSGTGGAVAIAGGAGSGGNANGGAVSINGGAKNGSGAHGAITIGASNTASITFGVMPRYPVAAVAAAGNAQGNAGALSEGVNIVSAADDTKGVVLPSADAGMVVYVKSTVSNKILKVYPNTSDVINALSADAAISLASGPTPAIFIAADATTWYTFPLLPS